MSEEQNTPFPLWKDSEAQTLAADLRAHLQQEPMDSGAQEMLLSVQKLQALPSVQPSAKFEADLRRKISRLPPRKPLWKPKVLWSMGTAAAVLLTLFLLRPTPIQQDPISQNLLTLNQSAFEDELMQINLPLDKSEIDLSPEMLKYPIDQIHRSPSLAL